MNEDNKEKPKYTYDELNEKYVKKNKKNKEDKKGIKGLGKAYAAITNFVITLIITILLSVFVGPYLDNLLGTKPLFLLLFLFLGILASFRNLIVYSK